MTQQRRLDKVESSLTPTQAMVLWLEEAPQHGSLQAYVHGLKEQPANVDPLVRLPRLVRQAVQDAYKGYPKQHIAVAVDQAERDVIFLYKLFMAVNARVLGERRTDALGYLWLLERLRRLWDAPPAVRRKEALTWREHALPLASEAYALAEVSERLAQRYFAGHPLLFPAEAEMVVEATQGWDALLGMYSDQVDELPPRQRRPFVLARELARANGAARAENDAKFLVTQAKAETLQLLGDYEGAALLVEPYL